MPMSPQLLERASEAYRRGYRDGYDHSIDRTSEYAWGSIASHDYADGYVAGHNERSIDQPGA